MKIAFTKYISRFILLVVALQILNMSVCGRAADDVCPACIDDSVNIADHAIEFIAENILGFTNAFPERKENKQQHSTACCQKAQEFVMLPCNACQPVQVTIYSSPVKYSSLQINPYCSHTADINTPPPKTA